MSQNSERIKMREEINYSNWPSHIKLATALSNKKVLIKNYKIPLYLAYFLVLLGLIGIIYSIVHSEAFVVTDLLDDLCYAIIGGVNILNGYSLKWILNNSSWEERFANSSTLFYKIFNVFISVILLACLYGIFMS